jgi:predicted ATPase/transcriptional regulator with XRE-family HTH domain/tetratricopeptide (TPR) repeat protein
VEAIPSFGMLLRQLRKARDLSQDALAKQAFCALDTIKKIETGRRRPSRELAIQFANVLELNDTERTGFLAAARAAVPVDSTAIATETKSNISFNKSRGSGYNSLPQQITPFIGRVRELGNLCSLIVPQRARLITIIGPGGMGKTRLALAAAEQLRQDTHFPDGVAFAALAAIDKPDGLDLALADALGLPIAAESERSPQIQILDYLRAKTLLLVLDNCEHLLAAITEWAMMILAEAPSVMVLATSRERLGLRSEWQMPLDGMEPADDGVQLFALRAQAAQPAFTLDAVTRPPMAAICAKLGGMPLAIELAAGWIDTLSLADIATELDRGDEILTSQAADLELRHRSVRFVCDTTWALLTPAERAVFTQLAVFSGGATRHALQAVAGASLEHLQLLVGKALLRYEPRLERYSIHELLRQYAAEYFRADAVTMHRTRESHAFYYLNELSTCEPVLKGAGQHMALSQINSDIGNIRLAWAWAVETGAFGLLADSVGALSLACEWLGRSEDGRDLMHLAAAASATTLRHNNKQDVMPLAALHATLLATQSRFAFLLGDTDGAAELLNHAQAVLDNLDGADQVIQAAQAQVFLMIGRCAVSKNPVAAAKAFAQSYTHFQALHDQWSMATALVGLGMMAHNISSDFDGAQRYLEQSVAHYRSVGDRAGLSQALSVLSTNARFQNRVHASELLAREAYALAQEIGNPHALAQAGTSLGAALSWSYRHFEATEVLHQTLIIFENLGHRAELPIAYIRLGFATMFLGQYSAARLHFAAGLRTAQVVGSAAAKNQALSALSALGLAEGANAEACHLAEASIELSRNLTDEYILSESLGIYALAKRRLGDSISARAAIVEALRLNLRTHILFHWKLWTIALLLADDQELAHAAKALALAELHWPQTDIFAQDVALRELHAILPSELMKATQRRWAGHDPWKAGAELLAALETAGWAVVQSQMPEAV